MDEPLGRAVGNAIEVAEAAVMLQGRGAADFDELVTASAGRLLALSDLGVNEAEGRRRAEAAIASGDALRAMERWVEAQGGDPRVAADPWSVLERAPATLEVRSPGEGWVARVGALAIGRAAMTLGAGRARKGDPIDHAVGLVVDRVGGRPGRARQPARDRPRPRRRRRRAGTRGGARRDRPLRGPRRARGRPDRDDRLSGKVPCG
jgi:thymidine phosphorylase